MPVEFPKFPRHNLYEVEGQVLIGPELIDANNHVGNAHYLEIYQAQRELYIAQVGILPFPEEEQVPFTRSFVVNGSIHYERQVFEGETVTVYTAAEDMTSHLLFYQRMAKPEVAKVGHFICSVYTVDGEGKMYRYLHPFIRGRVNTVNKAFQNGQEISR